MTRFKDFALSPYFNKHVGVQEIVLFLNGIYPQFTEKTCSNEALTAAVFPDDKTALKKIPVLLTYVRRLLYQFLDIEAYSESSNAVFLLKQLRQKKQIKAHLKLLQKEKTKNTSQKLRDRNFFLQAVSTRFRSRSGIYTTVRYIGKRGSGEKGQSSGCLLPFRKTKRCL